MHSVAGLLGEGRGLGGTEGHVGTGGHKTERSGREKERGTQWKHGPPAICESPKSASSPRAGRISRDVLWFPKAELQQYGDQAVREGRVLK